MNTSVITEMARRLRASDQWDNLLGDKIAFLIKNIELLEAYVEDHGPPPEASYRKVKRPFTNYADCRKVLSAIAGTRTDFGGLYDIESCLSIAVMLHEWEKAGEPPPSEVRAMDAGSIAIEWEGKGGRLLIVQYGVVYSDNGGKMEWISRPD